VTDAASYPSLRGRVALVTGGATGIGAAVVKAFVRAGSRVAFLDIDRAAGEGLSAATGSLFLPCDLTDIAALQAAVAEVERLLGPVQALVSNAANDLRQPVDAVTPDDWGQSQDVNIRHQFFAAQAVHRGMKAAGGGAIVNLSSIAFMFGAPEMVPYITAKAAVIGLTNGLARAYGPDNIRVNAIAPGAVMTEKQLRLWHTPESKAALVSRQSIPHDVTEDDIAASALFLCSDDARSITKQCLIVDGGLA
jgi:NAD(P)-dependent dehydrogenase (short-subunit alcohol dehydrogenase family)